MREACQKEGREVDRSHLARLLPLHVSSFSSAAFLCAQALARDSITTRELVPSLWTRVSSSHSLRLLTVSHRSELTLPSPTLPPSSPPHLFFLALSPAYPILAYCGASIMMTVVNKYVVSGTGFDMNFLLLTIQSAVCVAAVFAAKKLGVITFRDWDSNDAKIWFPISALLVTVIYTGSKSLVSELGFWGRESRRLRHRADFGFGSFACVFCSNTSPSRPTLCSRTDPSLSPFVSPSPSLLSPPSSPHSPSPLAASSCRPMERLSGSEDTSLRSLSLRLVSS